MVDYLLNRYNDLVIIYEVGTYFKNVLYTYNYTHQAQMEGKWLTSSFNILSVQFVTDSRFRQKAFHLEYEIFPFDGRNKRTKMNTDTFMIAI